MLKTRVPNAAAIGRWKDPVATLGELPTLGNQSGDARIVLATPPEIHVWDGDSWEKVTGVVGGGGGGSLTDFQIATADYNVGTGNIDVVVEPGTAAIDGTIVSKTAQTAGSIVVPVAGGIYHAFIVTDGTLSFLTDAEYTSYPSGKIYLGFITIGAVVSDPTVISDRRAFLSIATNAILKSDPGLAGFGAISGTIADVVPTRIGATSLASAYVLYQCPADKKACMLGFAIWNEGTSNQTVRIYIIKNGQAAQDNNRFYQSTIALNAIVNFESLIVLEPGDKIAAYSSADTFVYFSCRVIEQDLATSKLRRAVATGQVIGIQTAFTCTSGKRAMPIGMIPYPNILHNTSAGSNTISLYAVPSGGSPAASNRVCFIIVGAGQTTRTSTINFSIPAGGSLVTNGNANNAVNLWMSFVED